MKSNEKSLFILFLIISSNILSIHSNLKYSTISSEYSESLKFGKDTEQKDNENISDEFFYKDQDKVTESQMNNIDSLNMSMMDKNDNFISNSNTYKDKLFNKVYNFILGMIKQIPQFTNYEIKLKASMNNPLKPQCSKEKFMEEFYKPRITADMKKAKIKESLNDLLIELGDSDYVRDLDWSNPREACKIVKILHHIIKGIPKNISNLINQ